jgi:hypothetical protein
MASRDGLTAHQKLIMAYWTTLRLSSDTPEQLRATDVSRVMSAANQRGEFFGLGFKKWLLEECTIPTRTREVLETEW